MKYFNTDVLKDRKGVHVVMTKEAHLNLRMRLFQHGLSLQSLFDELARMVVEDDKFATRIIERLVMKKVKDAIEGKTNARKEKAVSETDHETLYGLIEEGKANDKESEEPD